MCWELPGGRQGPAFKTTSRFSYGDQHLDVADKQRICATEKGKALGVWESMPKFCQNQKEMNRRKGKSYDFLSNSEE